MRLLRQSRQLFAPLLSKRCISSFVEKTIDIDGQRINFLKTGTGSKVVFCLPGSFGSIWTDFRHQIENMSKDKYTFVVWDPPGYGKSRPPNKMFDKNFYRKDAECASSLLQKLGIEKCSLLGWSDGGTTALILAAECSDKIDKLAIWGANAYVTEKDIQIIDSMSDLSKWSHNITKPLEEIYGMELLSNMNNAWTQSIKDIFNNGGSICKEDLGKIKAEVLILHGEKDVLVHPEHPEYLAKHLPLSRVYRFPNGKHNLHMKYSQEFNGLIDHFLGSSWNVR